MGTAERRNEIMRILCRRRYETISNLASEFSVSKRTILRDIEVLSLTEPIYTKQGKYDGGVYITDDFYMSRMYMSEKELAVLQKLSDSVDAMKTCELDASERLILKNIISQYKKPTIRKEIKNEKTRERII